MTMGLASDDRGRIGGDWQTRVAGELTTATAGACGPGLGRSADLDDLVAWLYRESHLPLVFDADGLNSLAAHPAVLTAPGGPRVLTPHPGEFARLMGLDRPPADNERASAARALAKRAGAVVVLKGHRTVVTDGEATFINTTGNPGMATAGMGDVLTGVVTALLCQKLPPLDAARLGAHLHGLAGDLAAEEIGPVGLTARDVIDRLPRALSTAIARD